MTFITLRKQNFLSSGRERNCYLFPGEERKLIKILKKENKSVADQNKVDVIYYKVLEKRKVSLSHLPKCYGYVNTNFGKGLVFERVLNYDGSECKSFRYMIAHKLITIDEQEKLLKELKEYLFNNKILFADASLTNILYQRKTSKESKLIIIDGLGAKRMGVKFLLYRMLSFYNKYKMYKQWNKLITSYKKDLKRIDNPLAEPIIRF